MFTVEYTVGLDGHIWEEVIPCRKDHSTLERKNLSNCGIMDYNINCGCSVFGSVNRQTKNWVTKKGSKGLSTSTLITFY